MVFLFAVAYIVSKISSGAGDGFRLCSVVPPMTAVRKKKKKKTGQSTVKSDRRKAPAGGGGQSAEQSWATLKGLN